MGRPRTTYVPGERFGRVVVIEEVSDPRPGVFWRCRCDCGGEVVARATAFRIGNTSSCGCFRREVTGSKNRRHGLTHRPEHKAWRHIKSRCHNPNDTEFRNYGGRGIAVCEEWRNNFESFFAHIGPRPTPHHSIDRINVNDGYRPGNVRWATVAEQTRNQRRNIWVEHEGRSMILSDFAALFGLPVTALAQRMRYHRCSAHEALARIQRTGIRRKRSS